MAGIDLHTHTRYSDGTLSPKELVALAKKSNLSTIAITDHDTMDGVLLAQEEGKKLGVTVIAGCEISALSAFGEIHILGFWVPLGNEALCSLFERLRRMRYERNCAIVEKLIGIGKHISMDEVAALAGEGSCGRPHIAQALLAKGYIRTKAEAFQNYIGEGCVCYVPKKGVQAQEAVSILSKAKALVCLAHPFLYSHSHKQRIECIQSLIPFGLDALEAYHSEHSREQSAECLEIAKSMNLGVSGGSDFHGSNKPTVRLGVGKGNLFVPETIASKLYERLCEKR